MTTGNEAGFFYFTNFSEGLKSATPVVEPSLILFKGGN